MTNGCGVTIRSLLHPLSKHMVLEQRSIGADKMSPPTACLSCEENDSILFTCNILKIIELPL